MDEPLATISPQPETSSPRWKTDWIWLVLLLLLATVIRVWLLCHTEVTSRDSIGFERYAWELEHKKWKQVLRSNLHHPLYPLTILAASVPVRQVIHGSYLDVMQFSAQLASGLAGILLVIPMFFLGKELFDRRVGFWAAAIFQCLPVGARVMSDALSESLFLLTSATALLLAVRAFRTGSTSQFVACGLCAGLAYLTRPEGVLIVVAVVLVLVGRRLYMNRQTVWTEVVKHVAGLVIAVVVVAAPYISIIQGFSNKTTTRDVLKTVQVFWTQGAEERGMSSALPMVAMMGIWWPDGKVSDVQGHLGWSLYALASEISKGFFYIAWLPALIGLFAFRGRLRIWSGQTTLLVLCLLQCVALLRVAMVAGYVADRHVLIIVMCGLFWAVAAVIMLTERIRAKGGWFRILLLPAALLFLSLAGVALPKTLEPLHSNRAGHRAVGLWLKEHLTPADELDDPFCWAAHYAGRTFPRETTTPISVNQERNRYIVHDCRPDHRERFRAPSTRPSAIFAAGGKVVFYWPKDEPLEKARIVLFAVRLPSQLHAEN